MTLLINSLNTNHSVYSNPSHKSIILSRNETNRYKADLYLKYSIGYDSILLTTNHCCDCNELNNNNKVNCPITNMPTEFGNYLTNGHVVNILHSNSGKIEFDYLIGNEITKTNTLQSQTHFDISISIPHISITMDEAVSSFVYYMNSQLEDSIYSLVESVKDSIISGEIPLLEYMKKIANTDLKSIIQSFSPIDWDKVKDFTDFDWSKLIDLKNLNSSNLSQLKEIEWNKFFSLILPFDMSQNYTLINKEFIDRFRPNISLSLNLGKNVISFNKNPHNKLLSVEINSSIITLNIDKNGIFTSKIDIIEIQGLMDNYPQIFSLRNRMNNPKKNFKIDNSIFPLDKHFVHIPVFKVNVDIKLLKLEPEIDFLLPQLEFQWSYDVMQAIGDVQWLFILMLPSSLLPSKKLSQLEICDNTNIDKIPEKVELPPETSNPFENKPIYKITGKMSSITVYIPYTLEYELTDVVTVKKITIEEVLVGINHKTFDIRADFRHIHVINLKFEKYPLDHDEFIMHFNRLILYEYDFYKDGEYSDMYMDTVNINWSLAMHIHFHGMMHKLKYAGYLQYFTMQLRLDELRKRKRNNNNNNNNSYCNCSNWIDGEVVDYQSPQISSYDNPSGIFIEGLEENPSFYNFDYLQYMKWKEYKELSACGAKLERVYSYNFNVKTKISNGYEFTLHMDLFATYDLWSHWLMDNMTVTMNGELFYHHDFMDLLQTNENHDRIMGLYQYEILLREQAVSQRDGNLSNVMETVFGKYGWNATFRNMAIYIPYKFEIQTIASEAVAVGIGLYEGIMKLIGRFQPRCQEYYKYWKWFPQDMFPNTLWCNGTNIKVIFVDNKAELMLHRNLSCQKEELQTRIVEDQIYNDYIELFCNNRVPNEDYVNSFVQRTVEASKRYYIKQKKCISTNGLFEIEIKELIMSCTLERDKVNIFNIIQAYDEDVLLSNENQRKPLIEYNINTIFNFTMNCFSLKIRNQSYPILQSDNIKLDGDALIVLFSTYNCFHENSKIRCVNLVDIPLSFGLLYPKVYGKIKIAGKNLTTVITSGHISSILDTTSSLYKFIYYYLVYGNLSIIDFLRFLLHFEVKAKFDIIRMKLLNSNDPYISVVPGIEILLISTKLFAPKVFYHIEVDIEDMTVSIVEEDTAPTLILDIPKQNIVLEMQYHKTVDKNHTHYVFPFVYTKNERKTVYEDCDPNGTNDRETSNSIRDKLLQYFITDYFKLRFGYEIMKMNRPPVFEISLDKIQWLLNFLTTYYDEFLNIKYYLHNSPLEYIKKIICKIIDEVEINKIIIEYFEAHIYETIQHNVGLLTCINNPSYVMGKIIKLNYHPHPNDFSVLPIFFDGCHYWCISNTITVINNVTVRLYNSPDTFNFFSSVLQLRMYQYIDVESFLPEVKELFRTYNSLQNDSTTLNSVKAASGIREEFYRLRKIKRGSFHRNSIGDFLLENIATDGVTSPNEFYNNGNNGDDMNIPIVFDKSNFTMYIYQFKTRINNDIILHSLLPLGGHVLQLIDNLKSYNKHSIDKIYHNHSNSNNNTSFRSPDSPSLLSSFVPNESIWRIHGNTPNLSGNNGVSDSSRSLLLDDKTDLGINFDAVHEFQTTIDNAVVPILKVHCEYPQFHIQNDDTNDVMISSMKEIGISIFSDDKFLVYKCLFLANNFRLFIAPSKLLVPDLSNDSIEWLPEQYGNGDEFGIFKPITDNFDITMQIWMSPFERHYVINIDISQIPVSFNSLEFSTLYLVCIGLFKCLTEALAMVSRFQSSRSTPLLPSDTLISSYNSMMQLKWLFHYQKYINYYIKSIIIPPEFQEYFLSIFDHNENELSSIRTKYINEKHKFGILLSLEELKVNTELPNLLLKMTIGIIHIDFNDMVKNYSVTHFKLNDQLMIFEWNADQTGNLNYYLSDASLEATPYNEKPEILFSRYGNDSSYFLTFHCNGQYSEIEPHFIIHNLDVKISPIVLLVSPTDGFQLLIQFLTPISTENQPSKLSLLKSFKKSKNIIESYRIFHLPILFDELIFNSIDVNLAVGSVEGKTYHFSINAFELPNDTTCDLQNLIEKIYSHLLWSSGNIISSLVTSAIAHSPLVVSLTNYFKNRQSVTNATSNTTSNTATTSSNHPNPPPTALATENVINEKKKKNILFRRGTNERDKEIIKERGRERREKEREREREREEFNSHISYSESYNNNDYPSIDNTDDNYYNNSDSYYKMKPNISGLRKSFTSHFKGKRKSSISTNSTSLNPFETMSPSHEQIQQSPPPPLTQSVLPPPPLNIGELNGDERNDDSYLNNSTRYPPNLLDPSTFTPTSSRNMLGRDIQNSNSNSARHEDNDNDEDLLTAELFEKLRNDK